MRFQVPQFIEVEDKIFGPLTFKQFLYVIGGGAAAVVFFSLLPKFIAIFVSIPFVALGLALAFFKVNDRPFALMVEDFVKYYVGARLYIWKKTEKSSKLPPGQAAEASANQLYVPKLSGNKLKDLTFELDIKQQSNPVTKDNSEA